jgi:hypothetical protein
MLDKLVSDDLKEKLYLYVKENYWIIFRSNTSILSSTCRQLALGIGGVLLLGKLNDCYGLLGTKIIFTLLVLFFILDAGQYWYQSFSFRKLAEDYDRKIDKGEITNISDLVETPGINNITNTFFIGKLFTLILASLVFIILIWRM